MLKILLEPKTDEQLSAVTAILPQLVPFLSDHEATPKQRPPEAPKRQKGPRQAFAAEAVPAAEAPHPDIHPTVNPVTADLSLTDLRARLAEISKGGKTDAVKLLVQKYGGQKLTDISAERYADLLAEAEAL